MLPQDPKLEALWHVEEVLGLVKARLKDFVVDRGWCTSQTMMR